MPAGATVQPMCVQRALNAVSSESAFDKARASIKSLADAAVAGKADKAARAASDLFDKTLPAIADEFAPTQKEMR